MTATPKALPQRAAWPAALTTAFLLALFAVLDDSEAYRLDPYYDSVGIVTVCRGLTNSNSVPLLGRRIVIGERWTREECESGEATVLQRFNLQMRNCTGAVPVTMYEHFAYLHFGWNVGISAFCSSTLANKLRARDYRGACDQILRWVYAQGRDCRVRANNCYGLVVRRQLEQAICAGEVEIAGLTVPILGAGFGS